MKKPTKPVAPRHLSAAAKAFWRRIQAEYGIEDAGGLAILTAAAEAFARMHEAAALVEKEGMTTTDRFGQAKAHPAVIIERDARTQHLAALKALNLDVEPLADRVGRPSGGRKGN